MYSDEDIKTATTPCKDEKFKVLKESMREFAMKIEIFDPLDREILNEDEENQAITRNELLEEIIDL